MTEVQANVLHVQEVVGDIIAMAEQGELDFIVQGANCICTMKSGIARSISDRYPEAVVADNTTTAWDFTKLGTYTTAQVRSLIDPAIEFAFVNAYTQRIPSRGDDVFEYDHFRRICEDLKDRLPKGSRIGFPKIGGGLARGDWPRIRKTIFDVFATSDHTVVIVYFTKADASDSTNVLDFEVDLVGDETDGK